MGDVLVMVSDRAMLLLRDCGGFMPLILDDRAWLDLRGEERLRLDLRDRSVVFVVDIVEGGATDGGLMSCAVTGALFETSLVCLLGEGLPTEGFRDNDPSLGADIFSEDRLDNGVTLEAS